MKRGALFFDRDGTLIEHVHYLHRPEEVRLMPGARELLMAARERGYLLFVLTNQSGVGRGYFAMADVEACHVRMLALLDLGPEVFEEICIAPEHPEEPSAYRKPKPDFILEKIAQYDLDPTRCLMLGDMPSDWLAAINAGIRAVAMQPAKPKPEIEAERVRLQVPAVADLRDLAY